MIESISEAAGVGVDLKRGLFPRRRSGGDGEAASPHSLEAEQCVLGCVLWQPELLVDCQRLLVTGTRLMPGAFYDLRHQMIFDGMCRLRRFDLVTLMQHLKDRCELELVGGLGFLASLQDKVPSAANLPAYLDVVNEKTKLRNLISTCADVAERAQGFAGGDVEDLLFTAQTDLVSMMARNDGERGGESWNIGDLHHYDTANDPNCILGFRDGRTTRYLCRGHGAWLIGPSGVGKSSLSVQQSLLWASGAAFCGIQPVRPMRVLIVQAENDKGDAAEQVQGILNGMQIDESFQPDDYERVRQNVRFVTERRTVGQKFALWLERQIVGHRADIVVIDPLLSFAGIDVSRQDMCTNFLRSVLNPVLADTGAVLIGAHHTGKPKNAKDTANWTVYDHAYAGIGSSELVNWARAISVLVPLERGKFELRLAKRGQRAWATHPNGEKTTSLFLQHAATGIHWEQIAPPEEPKEEEKQEDRGGRPSVVEEVLSLGLGPLLDSLTTAVPLTQITNRIEAFCAVKRMDVSEPSCRRVVKQLVANGALVKEGKCYRKA